MTQLQGESFIPFEVHEDNQEDLKIALGGLVDVLGEDTDQKTYVILEKFEDELEIDDDPEIETVNYGTKFKYLSKKNDITRIGVIEEDVCHFKDLSKNNLGNYPVQTQRFLNKYINYLEENKTKNAKDDIFRFLIKKYGENSEVKRQITSLKTTYNHRSASVTDTYGMYLDDIGPYKVLNKEEEVALFNKIEHGLSVFGNIISGQSLSKSNEADLINLVGAFQSVYILNLKLVTSVVKKRSPDNSMSNEELVAYGNIGLEKAVRRFDVFRGFKFSTYAMTWIKQSMQRAIQQKARLIYLPAEVNNNWARLYSDISYLEQELKRPPSNDEISNYTGFSKEEIEELKLIGSITHKSINEPIGRETDTEFSDLIATVDNFDEDVETLSDNIDLDKILEVLDDREKLVISLMFGKHMEALRGKTDFGFRQAFDYDEYFSHPESEDAITFTKLYKLTSCSVRKLRIIYLQAMNKILEEASEINLSNEI